MEIGVIWNSCTAGWKCDGIVSSMVVLPPLPGWRHANFLARNEKNHGFSLQLHPLKMQRWAKKQSLETSQKHWCKKPIRSKIVVASKRRTLESWIFLVCQALRQHSAKWFGEFETWRGRMWWAGGWRSWRMGFSDQRQMKFVYSWVVDISHFNSPFYNKWIYTGRI